MFATKNNILSGLSGRPARSTGNLHRAVVRMQQVEIFRDHSAAEIWVFGDVLRDAHVFVGAFQNSGITPQIAIAWPGVPRQLDLEKMVPSKRLNFVQIIWNNLCRAC